MTILQTAESIEQIFPELKMAQIIAEINKAQDRFCRDTGVARKIGNLQNITTKVAWALPSNCIEVYDVELYDSNSKFLHKVDEDINWFIDDGYLIFYDTSSTKKITTIPTTISTIWVRYKHLPTALVEDNLTGANDKDTTFEFGSQWSEAILASALETLFARIRQPLGVDREGNVITGIDTRSRDYWRSKYLELKIDAKRYMNQIDSTEGRVQNYEHAGLYSKIKEAKNATVSATNWS